MSLIISILNYIAVQTIPKTLVVPKGFSKPSFSICMQKNYKDAIKGPSRGSNVNQLRVT